MAANRLPSAAGLCLLMLASGPARALDLDVPVTHATLQAAVAAAALSPDLENTITISVSPVTTTSPIDIGGAFGPARRLVIRPAAGLDRASIVNNAPTVPVIAMLNAGHVTLRDLDIVRNLTNGDHLVKIDVCSQVLIERCRIGSNATSTGTANWANVFMTYPTEVTLRNNILFARTPGTFDFGIDALNFSDPANALRLYNNVVSDYRVYGIRIDAGVAGSLVLLRNNVVANHRSLVPEPVAYRTQVSDQPTRVSSHNVAFASVGFVETAGPGAQSIIGATPPFIQLAKASVVPAFVQTQWALAPPWDDNADFHRLVPGGPLHTDANQHGFTVPAVYPDLAVTDDIEGDPRPTGAPLHTDRGADQLELTSRVGVGGEDGASGRFAVWPRQNPSGALALLYETAIPGRLHWELFDAMGRRIHRGLRQAEAGSRGVLTRPGARERTAGLVFYRVRLEREGLPAIERTGRAVER